MGVVELDSSVPASSESKTSEHGTQLTTTTKDSVVAKVTKFSNEEAQCLKQLRMLIKEDVNAREAGVADDEELLLAFVRGKNYNEEKAFKCLKNHVHVVRVKYRKFFKTLSPRNFGYIIEASLSNEMPKLCGLLKNCDHEGHRVGVGHSYFFDPSFHKAEDLIASMIATGFELLRTEAAPKNGLVLVIDAAGFGFRHAREFSMTRVYMFLNIFLSAYPVKYKGFHILNNGYLFDTILTIVKQLIPKKLRDRIHLHGSSFESLHKHVPREILPESFGGFLKVEDAYDYDIERRILDKTEHFEKVAANL